MERTETTAYRRYGSKLEKGHLRPIVQRFEIFPPFPCADSFLKDQLVVRVSPAVLADGVLPPYPDELLFAQQSYVRLL
jgi:hypothetical protein